MYYRYCRYLHSMVKHFSFQGGAIHDIKNKNKENKIKSPKKHQKKPKHAFPKRWRKGRKKGRKWGRQKWKGRNGRRGRRGHRRGKKWRNQKINGKPRKQFNRRSLPLTMKVTSETSTVVNMSTTSATKDVKKWEIINGTLVPSAKYMDEMLHSWCILELIILILYNW